MPRGKKRNLTLDEQIQALENAIETKEQELASLKLQRTEAVKAKEKQDIEELYDAIKRSGKTVEDVKELIK